MKKENKTIKQTIHLKQKWSTHTHTRISKIEQNIRIITKLNNNSSQIVREKRKFRGTFIINQRKYHFICLVENYCLMYKIEIEENKKKKTIKKTINSQKLKERQTKKTN